MGKAGLGGKGVVRAMPSRGMQYDGDQRPPKDVLAVLGDTEVPDQGSIFLGTRGTLLLPHIGRPGTQGASKVRTQPGTHAQDACAD